MKRTTEFVLGLIGGIFGFFGAILAFFVGGIGEAFEAEGAKTISNLCVGAIVFSLLAIVASVLVKSKPKLAGVLLLVSAIGGLISISLFYLLPCVLIFIASIMALFKKEPKNNTADI